MTDVTLNNSLVNVFDYEGIARDKLPQMVYDYYRSGAHDEVTLRENRSAWDKITLRPRMLVDVSKRSTATTVMGTPVSMPILVAPTAFHCLAHRDGELATARAAGKAGTIFTLSTLSNSSIEDVLKAATGTVWFQLYVYKDREVTKDMVQRAEAAGCKALVITVDSPLLGRRERDVRNRFQLPEGLSIKTVLEANLKDMPKGASGSGLAAYIASLYDTSLTWKDLDWFRSITKLPIVIKGILRGDDARLAVEHGASGIVVSNHGGRQLDTAPATIQVLPEIVDAVDGKVEVFIDGGIRRGTDVIKAIACGARAVLVGRPILWGLATDGEEGVRQVLELLKAEMDLAMALTGCPTVDSIKSDFILKC